MFNKANKEITNDTTEANNKVEFMARLWLQLAHCLEATLNWYVGDVLNSALFFHPQTCLVALINSLFVLFRAKLAVAQSLNEKMNLIEEKKFI